MGRRGLGTTPRGSSARWCIGCSKHVDPAEETDPSLLAERLLALVRPRERAGRDRPCRRSSVKRSPASSALASRPAVAQAARVGRTAARGAVCAAPRWRARARHYRYARAPRRARDRRRDQDRPAPPRTSTSSPSTSKPRRLCSRRRCGWTASSSIRTMSCGPLHDKSPNAYCRLALAAGAELMSHSPVASSARDVC